MTEQAQAEQKASTYDREEHIRSHERAKQHVKDCAQELREIVEHPCREWATSADASAKGVLTECSDEDRAKHVGHLEWARKRDFLTIKQELALLRNIVDNKYARVTRRVLEATEALQKAEQREWFIRP